MLNGHVDWPLVLVALFDLAACAGVSCCIAIPVRGRQDARYGWTLTHAYFTALALGGADLALRLGRVPATSTIGEVSLALYTFPSVLACTVLALALVSRPSQRRKVYGSAVLAVAIAVGSVSGTLTYPGFAGWRTSPEPLSGYGAAAILVLVLAAVQLIAYPRAPRGRRASGEVLLLAAVAGGQYIRWRHMVPIAEPAPGTVMQPLLLGVAACMLATFALLVAVRRFQDDEAASFSTQLAALRAGNEAYAKEIRDLYGERQATAERHQRLNEQLMESANAGFFEWDLESGNVRFGGPWGAMLGYRQADDLLRPQTDPWLRLCHEEDLPAAQELFRALADGQREEVACEVRMRTARGGWRWVRLHARIAEWRDGIARRVIGTQTDIEALKNAEHTLRAERSLFASGPVIMLTFDAEPPYRLREYSPNFQEARGIAGPRSPLGMPLDAFLHPQSLIGIGVLVEQATRSGVRVQREVRLARSDGAWPWYLLHLGGERSPDGNLLRAYLVDINRLKEAEVEAAERNQALQDVVHRMDRGQEFMRTLQQITELVQLCDSEAESRQIIARGGSRLFPRWSGALTFADSDGMMETGAAWGEPFNREQSEEVDCWAVRRGRMHQSVVGSPDTLSPICPHFNGQAKAITHAICAPLLMSFDRPGALHLVAHEAMNEDELRIAAWGAETFADALKLSLANLRLRTSLREQAVRDGMTDLYNRRYFDDTLRRELSRSQRTGEGLILAIADIDEFKRFNDTFGHEAGDKVIKTVAEQLRKFVRAYDVACRVGGEELAILMPRVQIEEACTRLEQLREEIGTCTINHGGVQLPPISVSIGVADIDAGLPEELQRRADMALYAAKHSGKNQVKRWTPELEAGPFGAVARAEPPQPAQLTAESPSVAEGGAAGGASAGFLSAEYSLRRL